MKKRARFDLESFKRLQETKDSLKRVESFPYSEYLRTVMNRDIYTCGSSTLLREVLRAMANRNISSAIITDNEGRAIGILTERDVMKRIVTADDIDIDRVPVAAVMTPNPVTLKPTNSIYRALSVLSSSGVKHLPITEDNRVVGMVTMRQILKLRYPEPMTVIESIQDARGTATLKAIKAKLYEMVQTRLAGGRRAIDIVLMISLINRDIHRRMLELAMQELGAAPAPFCLFVTGSHGRLENLLAPDQDHGIVIADSEDSVLYDRYWVDLTVRFSDGLNEIGFENCPGYIMSANPIWRKGLKEWKNQINYWFERQVKQLGRFTTILFDSAPIWGQNELFFAMNDFAYESLKRHHEILRVLHEEEGGHRAPLGFLGRFITEKSGENRGKVDVKRSGLIFIVEAVRILALQHDIRETSTMKRLAALVQGGFIHPDDGEYFESAYQVLLHFVLSAQIRAASMGKKLNTFIDPKELSRRDRETLRTAFKAVSSLQEMVASEFGELVL